MDTGASWKVTYSSLDTAALDTAVPHTAPRFTEPSYAQPCMKLTEEEKIYEYLKEAESRSPKGHTE